ncbi:NAD-binding protein [Pisolithus tinctorius]|nr:NAD-binding protein [Pisolithus tinctorius]
MLLLILSAQDVNTIIAALPSAELEAPMASEFRRLSSGSHYASPQKTSITMSHHTALFMPSRVEDIRTVIKVVSESGHAEEIVNASAQTALRSAASSVLATHLLLSEPPSSLVAFGAGKQIEVHLDLHIRAFLSLKRCTIVNPSTNAHLENLLFVLRQSHPLISLKGLSLDNTTNLRSAIGHANVICTATSSTQPPFPLQPGMVEVDCGLISRSETIVIDSIEACAIETRELIAAGLSAGDMTEIGQLVEEWDCQDGPGEVQMRKGDVMVFKSVGIGLRDVAIARCVVSKAENLGIGTTVVDFHM